MTINRRSVLQIIPAVVGGALARPPDLFLSAPQLRLEPAAEGAYKPLQTITLHGARAGTVAVSDGAGQQYVQQPARDPMQFKIGSALGTHTVHRLDSRGGVTGSVSFEVDCTTEIRDEKGEFRELLAPVLWTMMDWNKDAPVNVVRYNGRVYQFFVNWLFDHTLTLKGMKYFWPELKDTIDFYAETQRNDGMIWEDCYPVTPEANYFDWKFSYGGFVRRIDGGFRQLRRAPVESHVEQFFLEALYYTWKATGDSAWMKTKLDCAIKAVRYATSDPYRWSKRYQLMHRGYTIDTWDFVSDDQQKLGDDCVFVVHPGKSEFGVFFGDTTNLVIGCRRLAEMLDRAGRTWEAPEFSALAGTLQRRLDALAWNGHFYTHWIAENPDYKPDMGVVTQEQVSLSNAYSLNRGISHEQCVSIIRTYQRIRKEMPADSPGEFYGIYPPFQKNFKKNEPGEVWEYVNGGVLSVVAAELALGAFEHGFEEYAVDILRREKTVTKRYRGFLPVALRGKGVEVPQRTFQKLDLSNIANASFNRGMAGGPGWVGESEPPLADLPSGNQQFQGVPFNVMDLGSNRYRTAVILPQGTGSVRSVSLPVHAKAASLYLLHTAAGPEHTVGLLSMHYADGTFYSEYIEQDKNVGSWWEPHDSQYVREGPRIYDRLRIAWQKASQGFPAVGVYAAGFANPHPDREIAALEFMPGVGNGRWMVLAATLSDAPVFFAPYDDLSSGIPNGWSAEIIYALIEGLAGVVDDGVAFSSVALTPRWEAAGINTAEVTVRYPASRGYCSYRYGLDRAGKRILLEFTGSGQTFEVRVLLPKDSQLRAARLDGRPVATRLRTVEQSRYAQLSVKGSGVHHMELDLS